MLQYLVLSKNFIAVAFIKAADADDWRKRDAALNIFSITST